MNNQTGDPEILTLRLVESRFFRALHEITLALPLEMPNDIYGNAKQAKDLIVDAISRLQSITTAVGNEH